MANRIQKDYNDHIQQSSPDMDKLWGRIEQRIDAKQESLQPSDQTQTPQLTVNRRNSFFRYAAVAACLVVVVASTVIFINSDKTVAKDTNSFAQPQNTEQINAAQPQDKEDKQQAAADKDTDNVDKLPADKYADNQTATENTSEDPKNKIKELMETPQYLEADMDGKYKLVEELAKQLKDSGVISDYQILKRQNLSRVEITLPDGTINGILLK